MRLKLGAIGSICVSYFCGAHAGIILDISNALELGLSDSMPLGIEYTPLDTRLDALIAELSPELGVPSEEDRDSLRQVFDAGLGDDVAARLRLIAHPPQPVPPPEEQTASFLVEPEYVITSPNFADTKLRVFNPAAAGVGDTKQWSGFLDTSDKHLFFWFFEARDVDPVTAPTVLWLNGGPGCSSLMGLFFELGPSRINSKLKPVSFEWAWNNRANMLFVDQPVNVGLSWSTSSRVGDTVSASKDVYKLLELFFTQFPEYSQEGFHVAAESYGGHYAPGVASEILQHPLRPFNLTSVLVGNGLTSPLIQYQHYTDMACGEGGYPSVLTSEECDAMKQAEPQCQSLIQQCYSQPSPWACTPAQSYCNNRMWGPYSNTGQNFYDIRQHCGDEPCYSDEGYFSDFLNQPEILAAVGATGRPGGYEQCTDVYQDFLYSGDWMQPYQLNATYLLDHGIPLLVFAGDADFSVNWLGNEAWTRELKWSGHDAFAAAPLRPWNSTSLGYEAGEVRNYAHFTFLRLYGAGHMVPHDQPESSWDMVNSWLAGNYDLEAGV